MGGRRVTTKKESLYYIYKKYSIYSFWYCEKKKVSLSTPYCTCYVHNENYCKCIYFTLPLYSAMTRNLWAVDGIDKEPVGSFVQTNVWTCMLCLCLQLRLAVSVSTTVWVSCHKDWWCATVSVRVCWCMSSAPCLIKPASHRHSILEVSYSLTPLDAARVTNSILYLFCLPPSLVSLSHSAFV